MRVSIWYSTGKILILCRDGTNTIEWVIGEFVKKVERRLHIPAGSVKVKWLELTAPSDVQKNGGEYKLTSTQIIKDVVEDGGDLVAITEGPETGKSVFGENNHQEKDEEETHSESVKTCVQCGAEYRESENAMGSCRFHQMAPRKHLWGYVYDCCDQEEGPCKVGQHRSEHHADYPYERFKAWEDSTAARIQENWSTISRIDYENGTIRALKVDLLPGPSFFVRMYSEDKVKFVKVVDAGKSSTLEWKDGTSFWAQVVFSSERTITITFAVNLDTIARTITYTQYGKIESVHEKVTPERTPLKFAEAPSDFAPEKTAKVRRGKTFESLVVPSEEVLNTVSGVTGDEKVCARWVGPVLADQDTFTKDRKLGQYFITNFELTNNSDADVTIRKINCRITNDGAESLPCEYCFSYAGVFNEKTGRYYFPEDGGLPLTLPAHTTSFRIAVSSKFFVESAKPSKAENTRKRAHLSLPQPLLLEHTFLRDDGSSICNPVASAQINPPLEYPTQESFAKSHPELRVLHWTHCDDFCDASRKWFALCLGPLGEVVGWTDAGYAVLPDSIWSWAAAGNKGGDVVIPFFESGTKVSALVNAESGAVWGLRVQLSTDTGLAEDEFAMPDIAEMRKSLGVTAAKKDDGLWDVAWKILAGSGRLKVCSQEHEIGYGNAVESVEALNESGSLITSHPYVYVYNEETVKYDTTAILKIKC